MRRSGRASLLALVVACAPDEPEACPSAVALAESIYVECVESIGLEVASLEITEAGDIEVEFGESFTPELGELARRECEPLMEEALAVGLLACETTDVGHPASAAALAEQVERAADEGFSGTVAIVRDGELVWSGGVGMADRARGIANTPETTFDCGSIMKVMTAAAIYRLEADGLLSRAATLGELFADVPSDKRVITVDQVLAHTAGFDEFHDTDGDFEPMTREQALRRILRQELLFPPGSDEAYSNSGYTVLGAIVEDASGMAFVDYLRARFFDVAGMANTGVYAEALGPAAIGYGDGTFECNSPPCWPAPSWALVGNGGLVSTADDLVRWVRAVDDAVVLDGATRDAFREQLAAGVSIDGEPVFAYSGRNDYGFGAAIAEVPRRDAYVVVTSNAAADYNDTALLVQLLQMSLGALIELPPR